MWERVKKILPIVLLGAVGLGVSVAIEVVHRRLTADVNYASFCNVNANVNCDVVLGSRYALLGGVSVALWAILYYAGVLGIAAAIARVGRARAQAHLATVLFLMAIWGVLFSLYLAGIAFGVLRSVCLMCGALYVVNVALFVAAWRVQRRVRIRGQRQLAERLGQDRLVVAGGVCAVVALLAVGAWEALGRGAQPTDAADIA